MTAWSEIAKQVRERAGNRCEYCRMHESLQGATFHVEHILPRASGGTSELNNLAYACPSCNLQKTDRLSLPDADSGSEILLYNPRHDPWTAHFQFAEFQIVGVTSIGRALIAAFDLNSDRRVRIRHAEALFGLFPP